MKKNKIINSIYTIIGILLFIGTFYYIYKTDSEEKNISNLEVYFLNVGQGDSILIRNREHNILIDAGNNKDGKLLTEYFKNLNIKSFDYVVATHPHEDHIGGLDDIINNFKINHILMPDVTTNTKSFEDVLDSIKKQKLSIEVPIINNKFTIGELEFTVIYTGTDEEDLNADSIVLRMDYKNNSYLFTGDITGEVEKKLLDKNLDVKIYKVAHHGSTYSNTYDFLEKVTPEYAIISCGKDNDYYYPHIKAVNRIKKHTTNIYSTDQDGTIIIKDNGEEIQIVKENTNTDGDTK